MLSSTLFVVVLAGTFFHTEVTGNLGLGVGAHLGLSGGGHTFLHTGLGVGLSLGGSSHTDGGHSGGITSQIDVTLSKCDKNLIDKITQGWTSHPDNDFFEDAFSTFSITATTPGCLKPDVSCSSVTFTKIVGSISVKLCIHERLKSGKCNDEKLEIDIQGGLIVDVDHTLKTYSVYSKNNVIGLYACLSSPSASEGPPVAFVAVKKNSSTNVEVEINAALNFMASFGLSCTVQYPHTCP